MSLIAPCIFAILWEKTLVRSHGERTALHEYEPANEVPGRLDEAPPLTPSTKVAGSVGMVKTYAASSSVSPCPSAGTTTRSLYFAAPSPFSRLKAAPQPQDEPPPSPTGVSVSHEAPSPFAAVIPNATIPSATTTTATCGRGIAPVARPEAAPQARRILSAASFYLGPGIDAR